MIYKENEWKRWLYIIHSYHYIFKNISIERIWKSYKSGQKHWCTARNNKYPWNWKWSTVWKTLQCDIYPLHLLNSAQMIAVAAATFNESILLLRFWKAGMEIFSLIYGKSALLIPFDSLPMIMTPAGNRPDA